MSHESTSHSKKYTIATAILIIFHIIANMLWIVHNSVPPNYDAAFHTVLAMRFVNYIQHYITVFDLNEFLTISKYYPPFTHWVGMIFVLLGGYNAASVQFTGTVFFALTLWALYRYTLSITYSPRAAFFSVFFFSLYLSIFSEARLMMTDIPGIFFVLVGLLLLQKTVGFVRTKQSISFFIVLALGMLTRWTSLVFLAYPVLMSLLRIPKTEKDPIFKKVLNLIIGTAIVLLFCFPWYISNLDTIVTIARTSSTPEADDPQVLLSLENILYYPKVIVQFQTYFIGAVLIIAFVIPIVLHWWKFKDHYDLKKLAKHNVSVPFIITILGYIVFTFFIGNKNIRYLFPIMPFIALYTGWGVDQVFKRVHKVRLVWLTTFVLFFYIVSFGILSFGFPVKPQFKYAAYIPLVGWMDVLYLDNKPVNALFSQVQWPNKDVATTILNKRTNDHVLYYLVIPEKPYLNASTVHLAMYETEQQVPYGLQEADTDFVGMLRGKETFDTMEDLQRYIESIDVIVVPEKDIGPKESVRDYKVRKQLQEYVLAGSMYNFTITNKITLPDGDYLYIFRRVE
jgi:4-amino-4-deoxy-L-arabinose transferase-like glycosyltransferase